MLDKEKVTGELFELIKKLLPGSQLLLVLGLLAAYFYRPNWPDSHRLLTIVLFESAVVILAVSRFCAAFARELWEKHFKDNALSATASWLKALPHKYSPGCGNRYRQQVILDHEVFNVRGMGLIGAHTLKLEKVFVDLKISPSSNPEKLNPDPVAAKAFANARSVWDFLRAGKGRSGDAIALAIIGPPGCGKTTLLQHVAVTLAANKQRKYKVAASLPLLFLLRDHVTAIIGNPDLTLGELAQSCFNDPKRYPKLKLSAGWFQQQLDAGRCLVLLDGLDEVADKEQRVALSRWVDQQVRHYPRCRFIITSRPHGYSSAPLTRANVVEVQHFSYKQVEQFVKGWYLAEEAAGAAPDFSEAAIRQRARRDSDDLLRRLAEPKAAALNELTVNPLLLTMISMVHRYRGALPGSRIELYREICEVLLGRWRQAKGIEEALTADQKRLVLMPLAAQMMARKNREISTADALTVIKPLLRRVGVTGAAVDAFLPELQASSGLLLEREAGRWSLILT